MTEKSYPFDGISVGDASIAPYSADEWAYLWKLRHGLGAAFPNYGVLQGSGDGTYRPLGVYQTSVASTNIEVKIGAGIVHGRLYETTVTATLAIAANASGNPRIDTVVLRLDNVAQTIRLVVKQGTPAGSPVAPSLTQVDGTTWEIPLANIAVANGFSSITDANITNRSRSIQSNVWGWQPYAFPLDYIQNGSYDAANISINGSGDAIAIPFCLKANMLIKSITYRHPNTGDTTYNTRWGLFVEDTNDGLTAENTVRRVALGTGSGGSVANSNITVPATPNPQFIPPGSYWLVIQNNGATGIAIGAIALTNFESTLNTFMPRSGGAIASLGYTLDLVTGWGTGAYSLAVRLNGTVLGTSTF